MIGIRTKLAAFLQGSPDPRGVALAVFLGLLAGVVTGWNLTFAAVLTAVLLLNVHTRSFLLAWTWGLAGRWLFAGSCYRLGVLVLDHTPLGRVLSMLGDGPLVAMWDFDSYALVGGVVLAMLNGLPAAHFAGRFTRAVLARDRADATGGQSRPHGLLARLIFGRRAACGADSEAPLLRPLGLVVAPLAPVVTVLLIHAVAPQIMLRTVLEHVSELNRAEVSAGSWKLSLGDGRFEAREVALADPDDLGRDRLRIGRVRGRIDSGALWRGRVEIDSLELVGLRTNIVRRRAAAAIHPHSLGISNAPMFSADREELSASQEAATEPADDTRIDTYLKCWPRVGHHAARLQDVLGRLEQIAGADERASELPDGAAVAHHEGPRRSMLGTPRPTLSVSRVRIEELPIEWQLGRSAVLELTSVSTAPRLGDEPTQLRVLAPQGPIELTLEMNFATPEAKHRLAIDARNLELIDLVDVESSGQRCDTRGGLVHVRGEGWADAAALELSLRIESDAVDVRFLGPHTVAGLEPATWNDGLEHLDHLRGWATLAGPWQAPRLSIDEKRLVQQFKHQLRAAGRHELVAAIEASTGGPYISRRSSRRFAPSTATSATKDDAFESLGVEPINADDAPPESEQATPFEATPPREPRRFAVAGRPATSHDNKAPRDEAVRGDAIRDDRSRGDEATPVAEHAASPSQQRQLAVHEPTVTPPIPLVPRPAIDHATPLPESIARPSVMNRQSDSEIAARVSWIEADELPRPRDFHLGYDSPALHAAPKHRPAVAPADRQSLAAQTQTSRRDADWLDGIEPPPGAKTARPSDLVPPDRVAGIPMREGTSTSSTPSESRPLAPWLDRENLAATEPPFAAPRPREMWSRLRDAWPWQRDRSGQALEGFPETSDDFEERLAAKPPSEPAGKRGTDQDRSMPSAPAYQATRPEASPSTHWFDRIRR